MNMIDASGYRLVPPKKRSKKQVLLACLFYVVVLTLVSVCSLALVIYIQYAPLVPPFYSIDDYQPKIGSRIYSADSQIIAEFAEERRVMVPAEKIPERLAKAFMSAEDKRFYTHHGLDYLGILQALADKLLHPKEKLRGASTITQQVAKSLLASHESYEFATQRSLGRKVIEALLALRLETYLSKDQILYIYMSQTFLGHKAYGVQAASEHYFRKNVWELTLAEMATLAGLPQRPSDYSPMNRKAAALARRSYVLRRMHEDGYITKEEQQEAVHEALVVYPREEPYLLVAPSYTEQVRRELIDRYGERAVLEEGLEIYTALNIEQQRQAQDAVDKGLRDLDKRQGYRGPLLHIAEEEHASFIEKYRHTLHLIANEMLVLDGGNDGGALYVALVEGFESKGLYAEINVAGSKGFLPLAGMRWARLADPMARFDLHYLKDVRQALSRGDVVLVKATTPEQLSADIHNLKDPQPFLPDGLLFALEQEPLAEGALISVEPFSGDITAQVGGYDFDGSTYNRAIQACREPGSVFKPVVYSAAIDKLDYTASTLIDDKPLVYDDPIHANRWKPNNAGGQFRGRLPLRTCLKDSINTPAIRIAEAVGIDDVIKNARRLGMKTPMKRELGTALGSSCTTLYDLMQVYVTLNQYGERRSLHFILRIYDRFGNLLEDHSSVGDVGLSASHRLARAYAHLHRPVRQALDPQSAFIMVSLLKNVVDSGTASAAGRLGQPAAGKTGTTNDSYDAWYMGFTQKQVTGVWVGHDKKERPLGIGEQGGRTALPIWINFTQNNLIDHSTPVAQKIQHGDFVPPAGVVRVAIDPETGLLSRNSKNRTVLEYYRQGTEPTDYTPDKTVLNPEDTDIFNADTPM